MAVFLETVITHLCSRSTDPELPDVPLCEAVAVTSVTAAELLPLSRGSRVLDWLPMDHIHHSFLGTVVAVVVVVVRLCCYFFRFSLAVSLWIVCSFSLPLSLRFLVRHSSVLDHSPFLEAATCEFATSPPQLCSVGFNHCHQHRHIVSNWLRSPVSRE